MIYVISLPEIAFCPYCILTYGFHTANLKFSNGIGVITVCCGDHWVIKFLGFRVNKAALNIKLAGNVIGIKNKVAATKNIFQHPYYHLDSYCLTKASPILKASHLKSCLPYP